MTGPIDAKRRGRPPNRRGPVAAVIVVAALVVALILIGQAMIRHNAIQNCLDSGRRDCDSRIPS